MLLYEYMIMDKLDLELMISSFNIIILVLTLAYSFYYIVCFSRVFYAKIKNPEDVKVEESSERNDVNEDDNMSHNGLLQHDYQ